MQIKYLYNIINKIMNYNIQQLKISLVTNIPSKGNINFTKDLLYHPDHNNFSNLNTYPYITTKQLYPEGVLSQLQYDEFINIFFNKDKFENMLLQNKDDKIQTTIDENYISKKNTMIMLQLLFSTKYFIVNNIHQSLELMNNTSNMRSIFYNPFNTKFSYISTGGSVYTITKAVWLNDIVNHPKYRELIEAVKDTFDMYREFETEQRLNQERRGNKKTLNTNDYSYNLRENILPKYMPPVRSTFNNIQKHIKKGKANISEFYNIFEKIIKRYILNDKNVQIDNNILDIGIDNINIGYSNNYPKKEIFVLLDLIEGEVNENNKKEVYCPYTDEYLGNLLENLITNTQNIKKVKKQDSIYSIKNNEFIETKQTSEKDEIKENNKTDKLTDVASNFNIQIIQKDEDLKDNIEKLKSLNIIKNDTVLEFIKENNKDLYKTIIEWDNNNQQSNRINNFIRRNIAGYSTEIRILQDKIKVIQDKSEINRLNNDVDIFKLYISIMTLLRENELSKPIKLGGNKTRNKRSAKNKTYKSREK